MNITHLVSIIIPTYQEEKALGRTLDQFSFSLRKQFNFEVIVSDGGSTDGTVSVAKTSADVVVESSTGEKQNISIGRNRGAKAARGRILIFLNADVIIEDVEKFFSAMIETIKDDHIVAATCNVNIYPEEEKLADWIFHNVFNGYFWFLNILGMGMGRGECHVVRKEIFNQVGGYDEQIAAGEDYELFLRLHSIGKIKFVRALTVFESPRRFRKYGYLWISLLWFLNALTVFFFRRSLMDDWKPVR